MFEVNFFDLGTVAESEYTRVVLVSRYQGKWVFCKQKTRDTWEIPGGHIEQGEDWLTAAKREMYEETGATRLAIEPICVYSITRYALLCYAEIGEFEALPDFEMEKVELFDNIPDNITDNHRKMLERVRQAKQI